MEQEYEVSKSDMDEKGAKLRPEFTKKKSKLKRKHIIIAIIILVAVAIATVILVKKNKAGEAIMNTELVAVQRRDIKNTVTGASVLEPKDSYSVTARITGEILSDTFNEGDIVKKGDVLYEVDAESAQKSVTSAENSLKKAQRSYNDLLEDNGNLAVKANASGKVSEVLVKKGDDVNAGTKIANIYSDTYMEISLPFNENDVSAISVGASATVTVAGTGEDIWGSVSHISTASSSLDSHAIVRYVTIEVKNPGALTVDDSGTAIVNGVACADAAKFEYTDEGFIIAETSGEISQLYIKKQDRVTNGQIVARLSSDDLLDKINDAKTEVEEAQMRLDDAKDNLDDYTITAPIDGTIVTKNKKAGDNMMNGSSSTESNSMAEIYDLSSLKFQLSVDETEVEKIRVGQSVSVTADAVEGEFVGAVTKVGIDGTSSNGVTTYPVDVEIKEYGKLLPGMNITAEIVVEEAKDVLAIPVSAVKRGSVVYIKDDGNTDLPDKEKSDEKKPRGDVPAGSMPNEGMPRGEMPQGERGQMPRGEMPQGERGQMPRGEMPQGERGQNPQGGIPAREQSPENKTEQNNQPSGNTNAKGPQNIRMDAPEGYKAVVVELGINDLEYIEVISGLSEGQEVLVQSVASSGNSNKQQTMPAMGGGMPGAMGGNRSGMGGGMPGAMGGMGGRMPGGMR